MREWIWYGNAGHFCASRQCRFQLCTEVGEHLVSTVGEYYRDQNDLNKSPMGLGPKSFYETMVFRFSGRCGCGCGLPEINPSEVDGVRYETPKEANEGHLAMCKKYSELS